jgi:hypothetical protein
MIPHKLTEPAKTALRCSLFWVKFTFGAEYRLKKVSDTSVVHRVDPEYADAWVFYRRLRLVVLFLFIIAMVEIRVSFFVPGFVFALTFVAYFFLAAWLANWKCPRCGQAFFRAAFLRSLFGGRCFHCHLPKWCVSENGNIICRPRFPFGWVVSDTQRLRDPDVHPSAPKAQKD